jgi:prepilin signal peptidase PulO-like enzyme (type II secretory pathway)
MFDVPVYIFLFGIGLAVGSFVNVAILRFGFSESPQSRSHCMACAAQISSFDLVPVFSFLLLKGKCRACGSALSTQYPLVEILTAVLFVLAYATMPPLLSLWSLLAFLSLLVFLSGLVALVVYDLRHTLVPMPFVWTLLVSAGAASLFQSLFAQSLSPLYDSAWGGVALSGFFFAIYAVTRGRGMGLGDAYVAGAVGILLGLFRGIEAIMFSVWIGTAVYLLVMLLSSLLRRFRLFRGFARVTMKTELPFIPFLALGTALALFTGISPLAFGAWLATILWN